MPARRRADGTGGVDTDVVAGQREDFQDDAGRNRTCGGTGRDQRDVVCNVQVILRVGARQTPTQHLGCVVGRPTADSVAVDGGGELLELARIQESGTDVDVPNAACTTAQRADDPHRQRSCRPPAHVLDDCASRLLVGHADDERPAPITGLVVDLETDPTEVPGSLVVSVHDCVLRPGPVAAFTVGPSVHPRHVGIVGNESRLSAGDDDLVPLDGASQRVVAVGPTQVVRRHEAGVGEFGVQQSGGVVENLLVVRRPIVCPSFDAFVDGGSFGCFHRCRHAPNSTRRRYRFGAVG